MSVANPNRTKLTDIPDHNCWLPPRLDTEEGTMRDTENDSNAPESDREPNKVQEPLASPEGLTEEDLRLIKAMCETANPWYPERDMFPAWASVHRKVCLMLHTEG